MKIVTMYKAEDGVLFRDECDCMKYERKCNLEKKLDIDLVLGNVDPEDIIDWIQKNIVLINEHMMVYLPPTKVNRGKL